MSEVSGWEGWAILELMGHRRLSGYLREETIGGGSFLRLDVPAEGGNPPATQFYSPSAVYCITPTSEEIARGLAASNRPAPVHRYELPALEAPAQARHGARICLGCGAYFRPDADDQGYCELCEEGRNADYEDHSEL